MSEIGNIPNVAYGADVTNLTHNGISDSIKTTTPMKIPDDDAAVAIIRNARRAEILNNQQDADNGSDTIYKQLANEVAGGRFLPNNLRDQTGKITAQRSTTMETDNG